MNYQTMPMFRRNLGPYFVMLSRLKMSKGNFREREPPYFMGTSMVSCRFSLENQSIECFVVGFLGTFMWYLLICQERILSGMIPGWDLGESTNFTVSLGFLADSPFFFKCPYRHAYLFTQAYIYIIFMYYIYIYIYIYIYLYIYYIYLYIYR